MTIDGIGRAVEHTRTGRYDAAQEILANVRPESEYYPKALKLIAKCAVGKRDFAAAEAATRRAIEVRGESHQFLWILATVLRHQRKFAEAADSYARILELGSKEVDRVQVDELLAKCLSHDKNSRRAEKVLRDDIQHRPAAKNNLMAEGIASLPRRPPRRTRWVPFPGQISLFEDARRTVKLSLLRGYPDGEPFISEQTKFLTLGSCFASNLAQGLQQRGMQAFTEFVHENVNSTHANLAFLNWVENGVQDKSGELMQAAYGNGVRERYLKAAQECDVFVFTLGLAPAFFDKVTGDFFFTLLAKSGNAHEILANCEMRTTTVAENVDNMKKILATIGRISRKPVTTVLTVSPVPLAATTEMDSAVIADCLSKSTLRLACEEVRANDTSGRLHYWPSFEIVRWLGPYFSNYHPPVYAVEDRKTRHVSQWIVRLIIDLFLETYSLQRVAVGDRVTAAEVPATAAEAPAAAAE